MTFFFTAISVKGVGPKTALGMLAVCPAKDMISAIENNDVKTLKALPGIGAKTASQIVLDLKGKLVEESVEIESHENKRTDGSDGSFKSTWLSQCGNQ